MKNKNDDDDDDEHQDDEDLGDNRFHIAAVDVFVCFNTILFEKLNLAFIINQTVS